MSEVLLQVNDLKKHFPLRGGVLRPRGRRVYAVDGVSFQIERAETLALVGESGCGKSTVGRAILRLFEITAGQVVKADRTWPKRAQIDVNDPTRTRRIKANNWGLRTPHPY